MASSPKPSPYEVFLSFRGADTRNNFVSHLYSALIGKGIITFYDDRDLQYGQSLPIELVKAIQESAIAVVVLSQNYASSTWCLKELVKIVECKNAKKLQIYPIFYHVEPTDVRKQQNSFLEAFSDHELNFKDNIQMVNAWRQALTEVSNLTGVAAHQKNEASLIDEIVDDILWKLPKEASPFTESLVGMESRISDLKIMINKNPDEVRFIGIVGMGGVGKTTTARAIFEECRSKFDGSSFLQDVRQNKDEMVKLQQQLLFEVLNCEIKRIYNVYEGIRVIPKRMGFKRVLLVVDDVDDIEQLEVLAGQFWLARRSWFGEGSRIIVTTRNEQFLNYFHDKYEVKTLNVKEASLLFRDCAFENEHGVEKYKKLSHQVLSYADGLPLALKVLGHQLRGKEESFWLAMLRRLKEVREHKIFDVLQVSFDVGLKRNEQDIFLYIACFFRGLDRDVVMKRLHALCLHPEEGIKVLTQNSLISERRNYIYYLGIQCVGIKTLVSFEMHGLLQDMGHHIIRERANWEVRRYSQIWLQNDVRKVLLDYKGSAEAEGIVIISSNEDVIESKILEESFMNMNKLRFLQIDQTSKCIDKANAFQSSPQLPNGLQWLDWRYYPGKCLRENFHPTELVHLQMQWSLIESTPDFQHMPNLEVLDLRQSLKLVHIHPSLGLHIKIKTIDLSSCIRLEEFPTIKQMNSLEYLNLSLTGLQTFPEIHGNVDALVELCFEKTDVKGLPMPIKNCTGVRTLKLGWMDNDTIQLGNLTSFGHLHFLQIESSYRLIEVPQLPACLAILKMNGCTALSKYPNSLPFQLEILEITGSKIVKTPDISQLPNLLQLDMSDSAQLSEVHASLGDHKRIMHINLKGCRNLKEFPTIVDLRRLETLDLSLTNLQYFPEITGMVDKLRKISLMGTHIITLSQSIGRAMNLKDLNLVGCRHLDRLPTNLNTLLPLLPQPFRT